MANSDLYKGNFVAWTRSQAGPPRAGDVAALGLGNPAESTLHDLSPRSHRRACATATDETGILIAEAPLPHDDGSAQHRDDRT